MNYRHAFHAGNHGDVLKHAVMARILTYLTRKDGALAVLDAHAGIGRYDLSSVEALKTGEWRGGIARVLHAARDDLANALLLPYLDAVRCLNSNGALQYYPGSPAIALSLLRPQDRLLVNELHPADHATLVERFAGDHRVHVFATDALTAIKAQLPFPEKRGLVLIDPAFEVTDEAVRIARMVQQGLRRMAHVCMMIWYPVTTQSFADVLCAGLDVVGAKSALRAELLVRPPSDHGGLAGSGLVVINPPWTLEGELQHLLPRLAYMLGENGQGQHSLQWLVPPP
jgi:23S rRNA (adenine2030-N6)-methyltransferase